jgi:hypothetical protein
MFVYAVVGATAFGGDTIQEADRNADVNVSIVSVTPWREYVSKLAPGFELTGEEALGEVLPLRREVTQSTTLGIDGTLAVGGDARAPSLRGDPTAPDATLPEAIATTSTSIDAGLGADPFVAHGAATALFQEVQLLNRYVLDASAKYDAVPYLVRVQISELPFTREPLDTYVNLEFCTVADGSIASCESDSSKEQVLVVPLLATDDLEAELISKSTEHAIAAAAAAGLLGGTKDASLAGNGTIKGQLRRLRHTLGQDLNATWTVGLENEHTARVRIGASLAGNRRLAMVPHDTYLSVMVWVPKDRLPQIFNYRDPAHPEARGQLLLTDASVEFRARDHWQRRGSHPDVSHSSAALPPWWTFEHSACLSPDDIKDAVPGYEYLRSACLQKEPVSVLDDGKTAQLIVGGTRVGAAERLSAVLVVRDACANPTGVEHEFQVRSTATTYDQPRRTVTYTFPSLKTLAPWVYNGTCKTDDKDNDIPPKTDMDALIFAGDTSWWYATPSGAGAGPYSKVVIPNVHYHPYAGEPAPFPVKAIHGTTQIFTDLVGNGQTQLTLGASSPFKMKITAIGADLMDVTGATRDPASGAFLVTAAGTYTLKWANAVTTQPVVVTLAVDDATSSWTYLVAAEKLDGP